MDFFAFFSQVLLFVGGFFDQNTNHCAHQVGGNRGTPRSRQRRTIQSIYEELGPYFFRRTYRMHYDSFEQLCELLRPKIDIPQQSTSSWSPPNGYIDATTRLSIAIRYFAGGQPVDIALIHGVSHAVVFNCVWMVVDAINQTKELDIKFPDTHQKQQAVANKFKRKSQAGFDTCVGCVDGVLIWIQKPTENDEELTKCGAGKYFCGRKKKFGLNMQAVCDSDRRFLDVDISHPGSTSDFLAFQTSKLRHRLEAANFLKEGLCLFGDNAYTDRPYMATPFKSILDDAQDDYNFFHSQLRITIECAFGMLCHRWGILRKPMPQNITLQKTTALVMALCKLHNFCIGINDADVPHLTYVDELDIVSVGGFRLGLAADGITVTVTDIIGGGHHFDDCNRHRNPNEFNNATNLPNPRDRLLAMVMEKDLHRPAKRQRTIN